MHDPTATIATLGALLLLGLAVDAVGRFTKLPRVTLLLILGLVIGPAGFGVLSATGPLSTVAEIALLMIGFLLGEKLSLPKLRAPGRAVVAYSLTVSLGTALIVVAVLPLLGVPLEVAFVLGAIATATAPAAVADVVQERGAKGPFTDVLLGTVALDDAWGLILFGLLLVAAQQVAGHVGSTVFLAAVAREIGGAILLGVALGVPVAFLSGRIRRGEPTLLEALGIVLLCGGLAHRFGVAPLLATLALGTTVANVARHHARPFHAIEEIDGPFLVVLFVFAGASLHLESLAGIGWLGVAYVALRVAGRIFGGWLGGRLADADPVSRRWMGAALLPQAGVALGMGFVAANRIPEIADVILPVVIGSTVFFEIVGPLFTRLALVRARDSSDR
jgi:Kef-type K+ transport system membrane component KefB